MRLALGMTQTELASLLGKSLTTIHRYELLAPPKGKILFNLERLAREKRLDGYAKTFGEAIQDERGMELPGVVPSPIESLLPIVAGVLVSGPKTPQQKTMHDALQALMYQTDWPGPHGNEARKEMKLVKQGLRRVLLQLKEAGQADQPFADRVAAILRHRQDGMLPEQIAHKMHMSTDEVEALLSQYVEEQR
jgi:hypothetical protein